MINLLQFCYLNSQFAKKKGNNFIMDNIESFR